MRCIDQNRPAGNHRNQRQDAGDVQNQERVTRRDGSDEPDQIFPRVDDPAQRDGPWLRLLIDDFSYRGHGLIRVRSPTVREGQSRKMPSLTVGLLTLTSLANLFPSSLRAYRFPTTPASSAPHLLKLHLRAALLQSNLRR